VDLPGKSLSGLVAGRGRVEVDHGPGKGENCQPETYRPPNPTFQGRTPVNLFLTVTALSILSGVSDRPDQLGKPGPPPVKKVAFLNRKGWVVVKGTMWKEIVKQVKWGKVIRQKVAYTRTTSYPPGEVWAYRTDGTLVGNKALARLLENPVKVLVSADGNKVHPAHLRGVKRGTLILVLSPRGKGAPGRGQGRLDRGVPSRPSFSPASGLPFSFSPSTGF
jgi:hypothetical protein